MKAKEQILQAVFLGAQAFLQGKPRVPAFDAELNNMMRGRNIGETPEGEASSIKLLTIWLDQWDTMNLYGVK
jgi:hypothetical protein